MQLPFEKITRAVITRVLAQTNPVYGCRPEDRPVEHLIEKGVVVVNKSKGPTSHQVAGYVKKILQLSKAGHGGTLDPAVTGVLPVALGKATRVVQALLTAGKEYVCLMKIHNEVNEDTIKEQLEKIRGKIKQLPPVKSAVRREVRTREIYYVTFLEMKEKHVLFRIGCEAGTYIRKFVHDFGKPIGGAHMVQLIRTKAGPFNTSQMHTLQELEDAYAFWKEGNSKLIRTCVLPYEAAVVHLPKIWIQDKAVASIAHGADLHMPGIARFESDIKIGEPIAIMTLKDELVALAQAKSNSEDMLKDKGITAHPYAVFIEPDVYGN
ncbi:RNA-guided pseudouridylation complex pseudouridine synthase subunit Cbf5 [Candidatus Woesearchaeota archaeon]|nr:RNA-guided pseudouridylation complex pseudouridine synthase subunit Cbf5 [Candidatus Woesearchaeota archaeon]